MVCGASQFQSLPPSWSGRSKDKHAQRMVAAPNQSSRLSIWKEVRPSVAGVRAGGGRERKMRMLRAAAATMGSLKKKHHRHDALAGMGDGLSVCC